MRPKKKDSRVLNCRLDKTLHDRRTAFTEQTKLSKTAAVERALEEFLDRYEDTGQL